MEGIQLSEVRDLMGLISEYCGDDTLHKLSRVIC